MKSIIIALLIILIFSTSSFADLKKVAIVTQEWSPFITKNENNIGILLKVISESFKLEGYDVVYQFVPWKRQIVMLKHGKADAAAVWSYKPERKEYFLYSNPVYKTNYVFFHLKDFNFNWETVSDLVEKAKNNLPDAMIGGILGYTYGDSLDNAEKNKFIAIDRVNNERQNFDKLLLGRIKLFPVDKVVGYYFLKQNYPPGIVSNITHHAKSLRSNLSYLVFSKNLKKQKRIENLLKKFNSGLKQLQDIGRYDKIFEEVIKGMSK